VVRHTTKGEVRDIKRVILHCSATRDGHHIKAAQIREWHLARGWRDIGYHYVIGIDGVIEAGRSIDQIGAHVKGHNRDSIGICYIGGLDNQGNPRDTLTPKQRDSITRLCYALQVILDTKLELYGHNEFSTKACPSFDVAVTFEELKFNLNCYSRTFRQQRPPQALECTKHSARIDCVCGNRERCC